MSPGGELAVDVSTTLRRRLVSQERARRIAILALQSERVRHAMVSIAFISEKHIRNINRQYLNRDSITDVIAFGFRDGSARDGVVGDIYICPDVARRNASSENISFREEIDRLVVHGILHVLGYDHPESGKRAASKMWRRQETIVKRVS